MRGLPASTAKLTQNSSTSGAMAVELGDLKLASENGDVSVEVDVEKPAPADESVKPASLSQLFRYRDASDSAAVAVALVFAFAQGAAMPVFTVLLGAATDAMGEEPEDATFQETMEPARNGMLCLMGGVGVCGTIHHAALHWSSERQAARMRVAYLRAALERDTAWYDVNDAAALPTRMATEVQKVQDAIGPKLGLVVVPLGQFVTGLAVGFYFGWKLCLVIVCFLPLLSVSAVAMGAAATEEANQTWYSRAGAVAEEVLFSMRTVAAFGGERRELARYDGLLEAAMRGGVRAGLKVAVAFAWLFFVFGCSYSATFKFTGEYMFGPKGDFETGGDVIMTFFAAIIGVASVSDAAMPLNVVVGGLAAGARMLAVIDAPSAIERGEAAPGAPADAAPALARVDELRFEDVQFAYPSRKDVAVLRSVSFAIAGGQKIAFVGESGSGKSTIVQLLERFYDPDGGRVLVNGRDLRELALHAWRARVGFVGQEPVLFAASVLENLRVSAPDATEEQCRAAARQAEALDFLEKLPEGLHSYVGQGGSQMSGGQKQRIAIARALVKKPALLLLDEATSALDNASEKLVQATLDGLQHDGQLTVLSIAHRLSTVRNADRIFCLEDGAVAESGTHDELVAKRGVYHKLTEAQAAAAEIGAPEASAAAADAPAADLDADGSEANEAEAPVTAAKLDAEPANGDEAAEKKGGGEGEEEADEEKKRLEELKDWEPPKMRIFSFATPFVKSLFPLALLACVVNAAVMPLQGWFLSEALFDFFLPYKCPSEDEFVQAQCDDYRPRGTKSPLRQEANKNAWIFLGLAGVQLIATFSKLAVYRFIQEQMTRAMRHDYLRALIRMEIGFFDDPKNSAGGLTTTLAKQTQVVANICGLSAGQALESLCAMLIGIGLALFACWRVALAMLGAVPFVGVAMSIVVKMMLTDEGTGGGGAYERIGAIASEAVVNIRTVRACRAEPDIVRRFEEQLAVITHTKTGESLQSGMVYGVGMAIIFVLYVVVFAFGPWTVDRGFCDGEQMFKALFSIMFGVFGAGMGAVFGQDANKAKIAAADMFNVLDRPSAIDAMQAESERLGNPRGFPADAPLHIRFDAVRFAYPHRPEVTVLAGFTLDVPPETTLALVGPSGSGKSTIIQLLQRFYDVADGSLTVGAVALSELDIEWWRAQLGFVGQEPVLFDATLEENVKYGKTDATQQELDAVAKLANLDFVLDGRVAWADAIGPRGDRLSGGQKQRVAIARALVREPKVLLLDEATSALDSESERVVQEALDAARRGRTTFAIAHRLSTIQDADVIVVLVDGSITEQGTHAELLAKKGVYYSLHLKAAA